MPMQMISCLVASFFWLTCYSLTTPEKLDIITRKWNHWQSCLDNIGLLLVDEIHILDESRGACLEGLLTRCMAMQKIQKPDIPIHSLRIVALSATIVNIEDIASWLKAKAFHFGEEYRPVPLRGHVRGYPTKSSDFL